MKLSPFFPLNFLKKAAELYNDIYKQKKFTLCSKNIENQKTWHVYRPFGNGI